MRALSDFKIHTSRFLTYAYRMNNAIRILLLHIPIFTITSYFLNLNFDFRVNILFLQGSFTCRCCAGYVGKYCEERDGCYGNPCQHGGFCVDIAEGLVGTTFQCLCPHGNWLFLFYRIFNRYLLIIPLQYFIHYSLIISY